MTGLIVEFSLVVAGFLYVWLRQSRERRRSHERAAQLDFDFSRDHSRGA
jgi:hypothetical protein